MLQTQVLSKINVKSGTTSVRQYNFDYDTGTVTLRNRLKSIQECGGSAGTDCLRPTTITFQNGTPGVANPTTSVITASVGARSGDINGDGRDDLIYGVQSGSTVTWYVRFASNTGSYGSAIATGFTSTLAINPLVADVYGDGSEDLIIQQGTSWTVTRWNASTSAFVTATTVTFDTGSLNVMADTDGDGRPDLVTLRTDKYLYVRRNTSTGTTPSFAAATQAFFWNATPNGTGVALYSDFTHLRAGGKFLDFNGDGRQDIVARKNVTLGGGQADIDRYTLLLSNGSTFSTSLDYPNGIAVYGFANFNDDNCTDVILEDHIRISTCSGTSSAQLTIGAGSVVETLDWDGDGRSDILVNDAGTIKVYRSLSDGFATATSTGLTQTAGRYMSVDSNGDALSDLFFVAQSGGALSRGLHNGSLTPPDIATSISDGWNISATFTFTPISVDSYAPVSGAVFPYSSFQGPLYVMKLATLSDGLGGTYTNSYYYYGARINRQGRGFQGFEHIRTIDSRNGLYYLTYYKQEFPYTGSISLDRKYQDNGSTLISETTNHFTYQNLAGTSCNGRCFPYIDSATTITNDLSATAPQIDQTTASFTYDSNGNPTNITTTKTDKFSSSPYFNSTWTSVVLNTYTNDAANWCISLPTVSSVANTAAGQPTVTRRMNHVVDLTQCRFQSETIESASAVSKVATTFGYDSCRRPPAFSSTAV